MSKKTRISSGATKKEKTDTRLIKASKKGSTSKIVDPVIGQCLTIHLGLTARKLANDIAKVLKEKGLIVEKIEMEKYIDQQSMYYSSWEGKYPKARRRYGKSVVKKRLKIVANKLKGRFSNQELRQLMSDLDLLVEKNFFVWRVQKATTSWTSEKWPVNNNEPGINFYPLNRKPIVIVYEFPKREKMGAEDKLFKERVKKHGYTILDDSYSEREKRQRLFVGKMMTFSEETLANGELKRLLGASKYRRVMTAIVSRFKTRLRRNYPFSLK